MSSPIRVTYVYNCSCDEGGRDSGTSRLYPVEWVDAVDVAADLVGGELRDMFLFLTSRLYPIEDLAEVETNAAPVSGTIFQRPLDGFDTWASLVSGDLRSIVQTYPNYKAEAVDTWAGLVSGELRTILQTYPNYAPEAIDAWASLVSGELRPIVIQTTIPTDAVDTWADLVSGSLITP